MSRVSDSGAPPQHNIPISDRLVTVEEPTQGETLERVLSVALDPAVPTVQDPFLNTEDAGNYLGIPKATLLTWRVRRPGYGPHAVRAGGGLKYRLSELDRWLRAHEESFIEEGSTTPSRPEAVRTRNRASRVRGLRREGGS